MNVRTIPALLAPLALAVACAARSAPSGAPSSPEPPAPAASPAAEQAPAGETPAPPAAAPATPGMPSSTGADADQEKKASALDTLPEAEAALTQASQELDRMFVASSGPRPAAPSGGAAPAQAEAQTPARKEAGSCDTACKAFGSLRRAADAVCRLAGESDARCAKGRKLVDSNEKRVATCGC